MTVTEPESRCENGQLVYDAAGNLADVIYCHELGTETRPGKRRGPATADNPTGRIPATKHFCPPHASAYDLFSARLKVASLRCWEERGEASMTDCGHVRPVLTAEELAALAADVQRNAA